jgi:hypothetical protein
MDIRTKQIDVNFNMDEYMDEMKAWAARQGLSVLYNRADNKVWISDRRDGEGGMFNMFDFLCSDNPREFFAKNF